MSDSAPTPRSSSEGLGELIISKHVSCRRCGYDLIGLNHRSHCPECGLDVWETVTHIVDPSAERFPRLRNPVRVGNGLLALMLCILLAAMLQVAGAAGDRVEDLHGIASNIARSIPNWIGLASLIPAIGGLIAIAVIATPPPEEPSQGVRADVRRLWIGLLGWALLSSLVPLVPSADSQELLPLFGRLMAAPFAIIGLLGLRGLLKAIGQRSRSYRRLKGGRQSIDVLMAAQVARVSSILLILYAELGVPQPDLRDFGRVIMVATALLMIIGLIYLVGNVWLIRQSLVRPPAGLNEIVSRPTALR